MNSELRDNFEYFFNRPDTFTLGVCNGCQGFIRIEKKLSTALKAGHVEKKYFKSI